MKKLLFAALVAATCGVVTAKQTPKGIDLLTSADSEPYGETVARQVRCAAVGYVYNVTFTQKSIDKTGKKIEAEVLQGIMILKWLGFSWGSDFPNPVIVGTPAYSTELYVWNPKQKYLCYNEYAKSVKNRAKRVCTKLALAEKVEDFQMDTNTIITNPKKLTFGPFVASFCAPSMSWYGVATGTYKSFAGNLVTHMDNRPDTYWGDDGFGTWRMTFDAALTKAYRGETYVLNPVTGKKVCVAGNVDGQVPGDVNYALAKKGATLSLGDTLWN